MANELLLRELLNEAQRLGFLGPTPVEDQRHRSLAFAAALGAPPQGLAIDLGTGGGLPGLVLAEHWPASRWIFVEINLRRSAWLKQAAAKLGASSRVTVLSERAEEVGRTALRGTAQLVTARSFAPPAATAECAAPLLEVGGKLAVAAPPADKVATGERWPSPGLLQLGLVLETEKSLPTPAGPVNITLLRLVADCPDRFPRRTGLPEKRPLF